MTTTNRIITLAAATALSAGLGLAGAAPAQAAGTVWDRVAACESGGNWAINTGNGFYGGLQFTRSTWLAYGGGKYASTANKATKAQQIEIAKKVLVGQGPGAWPVCSRRAGLTRATGLAVASGVTSSTTKTVTVTTKAQAKPTKSLTRTKKPVSGAINRTRAAAPAPKARVTSSAKTVKAASTQAKAGTYVTVKAGDSLSKIAAAHGTTWQKVWELNKSTIKNPNMIKIGQQVRVR